MHLERHDLSLKRQHIGGSGALIYLLLSLRRQRQQESRS
jgi:hypothetical protein